MAKYKERGLRYVTSAKEFAPPTAPRGVFPTGSKAISNLTRVIHTGGGPGAQEEQYKGGTTSDSEFFIIWALRQIFKYLPDGGENTAWAYQSSYLGGRHIPGGAVVDFIIFGELWQTGLRIQTFFFHLSAGSEKQESDYDQKISLEGGGLRIIDIYEQDYIHDKTGKAAIRVVLEALAGTERMNPRSSGQTVDR